MVKADLTRDYYGDLELQPNADIAEIKKQFKKLALSYHPDRNPGRESEVTAKFQRIQSAHEVLIDAAERAKYDANRVRSGSLRNAYAGSSGVRGNPWSNVSSQYPTPPKPPTARKQPPPPSAGAERYKRNFQPPPASAYQAAQDGPEARKSTYEAWENLRHNTKPDNGPGKAWRSPQPPPRESHARAQRPVPPRPQGFDDPSGHHRSQSSSGANRKGFQPNTPGGDEPPAPRGNYFTKRDKPSVAPDLPAREPQAPSMNNAGPDPLRAFRDATMGSERVSTPYARHGGEKLDPFETANINRSKSTRERTDSFDPKSPTSPRTTDSKAKAPYRARSFAEPRSTPRATRASVRLDSSSDSEELPRMNGTGPTASAKTSNNSSTKPTTTQPASTSQTQGSSSNAQRLPSKPGNISRFRKWMKENPNAEYPPNGFPPDGPPLRSDPPKTDGNGNPSMYGTPSFKFQRSFTHHSVFEDSTAESENSSVNSEKKKAAFCEPKLPTVAEASSSNPQFYAVKTDPVRTSSSNRSAFAKSQVATPPSGLATDSIQPPNAFEAQQRNVLEGLLNKNSRDLKAFETQQRNVVEGLLNKRTSSGQKQATPSVISPSPWGSHPNPFKFNLDRSRTSSSNFTTYRDSAEAGSPSKKFKPLLPKHLQTSHTYDFDKSQAFWVEHEKRKSSADHPRRSSRFSFDLPNDSFEPTRPQKNSFSSSAENISTKFTPEDWDGKFEAGGEYFKPNPKTTSIPVRGRARAQSASRSRGRSPVKARNVPGEIPSFAQPTEPTPTASPGGTKFSQEEWAQTFNSQTFAPPMNAAPRSMPGRKRTGPTLRTTMGGNAAVVDDGSSEDIPLFTGRKPTASPTSIDPDPMDVDTPPVTHTVPQFTAAKINEKMSEPHKRPAASEPSSPVDTESLKVGFDDLKIPDLITSLAFPPAPKGPSPPSPAELANATSNAYEEYLKRYAKYIADWDIFDSKFLLHKVARKNQRDAQGEKRFMDEKTTELYRLGLKEDQAVLQKWMEATAQHEAVVREFCVVRERMKGRAGVESGKRASPRKKTH